MPPSSSFETSTKRTFRLWEQNQFSKNCRTRISRQSQFCVSFLFSVFFSLLISGDRDVSLPPPPGVGAAGPGGRRLLPRARARVLLLPSPPLPPPPRLRLSTLCRLRARPHKEGQIRQAVQRQDDVQGVKGSPGGRGAEVRDNSKQTIKYYFV